MKRSEIIAEMRGVKADLANVRGWCDAIEARADKVIKALAVSPAVGREESTPPTRIEYDAEQLDAAPRVRPEVFCNCGDPAKRIEKEGKNGKPYVAYACPNPKASGCEYWFSKTQL